VGVTVVVRVADETGVCVRVGVKVAVSVKVADGIGVCVRVGVEVAVSVKVAVHVRVAVRVGVEDIVWLTVAVGVIVSLRVGVAVEVALRVGVDVAVAEGAAVGLPELAITSIVDAARSPLWAPSLLTAFPQPTSVALVKLAGAVHWNEKVMTPETAFLRPLCVTSTRPPGPLIVRVNAELGPPVDSVPVGVETLKPPAGRVVAIVSV
jgi:hypothetical protein